MFNNSTQSGVAPKKIVKPNLKLWYCYHKILQKKKKYWYQELDKSVKLQTKIFD